MLNAIVRVWHNCLTFYISLSQEGAKLLYQKGNILSFVECDRDRYKISNRFYESLDNFKCKIVTAKKV